MPVAAAPAEATGGGPTYSEPFSDVWVGQTVTLEDETLEGPVSIKSGPDPDDSDAETITIERVEDGRISFDTSALDAGEPYHIIDHGADDAATVSEFHEHVFWASTENLAVAAERDTTVPGSTVSFSISSERETFDLNVSAEGLDHGELSTLFDSSGEPHLDDVTVHEDADVVTLSMNLSDGSGALEADFSNIDPDDYAFSFTVTDTGVTESVPIDVVDESVRRTIVTDPSGERGELINVTIDLAYTSRGAVHLGDRDEVAFETAAAFVDRSEEGYDEITLQYNTYEHTRDEDTHGWRVHPSNDAVELTETWAIEPGSGGEAFDEPLETADYPIATGESWNEANDRLEGVSDSSTMRLGAPTGPSGVATHTAPRGQDLADEETVVTATESVAHGDRLLVSLDEAGLSGLLDAADPAAGDDLADTLSAEGINVTVEPTEPSLNAPDPVWTTDTTMVEGAADAYELDVEATALTSSQSGDLVVELSDDSAGRSFSPDESYSVTVRLDSDSPFTATGDAIERSTSYALESPTLSWDDEAATVAAADGSLVTGTANLAPGSIVDIEATAPRQFQSVSRATVADDGTFYTRFDFEREPVGTSFDLVATHRERDSFAALDADYEEALTDEIEAELVDKEHAIESVQVDVTAPSDVEAGGEAFLEVTVDKKRSPIDEVPFEVVIDGKQVDEGLVDVSDGRVTERYRLQTDREGTIEWRVTVDGAVTSGTTVVDVADRGGDDGAADDDDSNGDGQPGFGIALAIGAFLLSLVIVRYRTP